MSRGDEVEKTGFPSPSSSDSASPSPPTTFEEALRRIYAEKLAIMQNRQRKYGPGNIDGTGLLGVAVRPETHIEVATPLIDMSKADIVRKGVELGAPLHLTWSCYARNDVACGRCDSCRLRLEAFRRAGRTDLITYAPPA